MLNSFYRAVGNYLGSLVLPELAYSGVPDFSSSRSQESGRSITDKVRSLLPLAHFMRHKGATNLHKASTNVSLGRNGKKMVVDKNGHDRFPEETVTAYLIRKTGLSHRQVAKQLKEHNRR